MMQLWVLEKQEQAISQRVNEAKSWFFEKVNQIDKFLAILINRKREDPNLLHVRPKGALRTDTNANQKISRSYIKNIYSINLENPNIKWMNI